jgi:sensor histidine kinase regulating citrate/malate metabolism
LPEELKKQTQYFNKVLTLLVVIFVLMTVIIAAILFMGQIRDSKIERLEVSTASNANSTASLDHVIRETLIKYQPDRDAQQKSRDTIQNNSQILIDLNKTIHGLFDDKTMVVNNNFTR